MLLLWLLSHPPQGVWHTGCHPGLCHSRLAEPMFSSCFLFVSRKLQVDFHRTWGIIGLEESWLNFGSDSVYIPDVVSLRVSYYIHFVEYYLIYAFMFCLIHSFYSYYLFYSFMNYVVVSCLIGLHCSLHIIQQAKFCIFGYVCLIVDRLH